MRAVIPFAMVFALTACDAQVPLDERNISPQAQAADFPQLKPLSSLVGLAGTPLETVAQGDRLAARAAALRRRAAALRGRDIFEGQDALRQLTGSR